MDKEITVKGIFELKKNLEERVELIAGIIQLGQEWQEKGYLYPVNYTAPDRITHFLIERGIDMKLLEMFVDDKHLPKNFGETLISQQEKELVSISYNLGKLIIDRYSERDNGYPISEDGSTAMDIISREISKSPTLGESPILILIQNSFNALNPLPDSNDIVGYQRRIANLISEDSVQFAIPFFLYESLGDIYNIYVDNLKTKSKKACSILKDMIDYSIKFIEDNIDSLKNDRYANRALKMNRFFYFNQDL